MPLYLCNTRPDAVPPEARAAIAADVTRIHCEVTGAPPSFVHVFFLEDLPQPPLDDHLAVVSARIRQGRSNEQKRQITEQITESLRRHAGLDPADTAVATIDVAASSVMEGGFVLPEPGEEAEWLEEHGHLI